MTDFDADISAAEADRLDELAAEFSGKRSARPRIRSITLEELLTANFPPRANLLSPWLPEKGIGMAYAPRGVGKTYFALGCGYGPGFVVRRNHRRQRRGIRRLHAEQQRRRSAGSARVRRRAEDQADGREHSPCFMTCAEHPPRSAPSAMRMPISRRRSATMYDSTP